MYVCVSIFQTNKTKSPGFFFINCEKHKNKIKKKIQKNIINYEFYKLLEFRRKGRSQNKQKEKCRTIVLFANMQIFNFKMLRKYC